MDRGGRAVRSQCPLASPTKFRITDAHLTALHAIDVAAPATAGAAAAATAGAAAAAAPAAARAKKEKVEAAWAKTALATLYGEGASPQLTATLSKLRVDVAELNLLATDVLRKIADEEYSKRGSAAKITLPNAAVLQATGMATEQANGLLWKGRALSAQKQMKQMKRTEEKHQREMTQMRAKLKAAEKAAAEKAAEK